MAPHYHYSLNNIAHLTVLSSKSVLFSNGDKQQGPAFEVGYSHGSLYHKGRSVDGYVDVTDKKVGELSSMYNLTPEYI